MANVKSSIALKGIRVKLNRLMSQSLSEEINVWLPTTLSKQFLLDHLPEGITESLWVAFAYYLVERVFLATLNKDFKITKKGRKSRKWVSLPYTAFQSIGQSKYVVLKKQLLTAGILECDDTCRFSTKPGETGETYGFRLGPLFRTKHGHYRPIKDAKVRDLLIKHRRTELAKNKQRIGKIAHVAKGWLHPERIELDKPAALDFLELYDDMMRRRLEKRFARLNTPASKQEEHRIQAQNRLAHARHQVEKWGETPQLTVDNKGGRFYNPLGLLLSPLRNFITYQGQPLVVLDLKNSQPLHLLLLLDDQFWKANPRQGWALKKLDPALWEATPEKEEGRGHQEAGEQLIESQISEKAADTEHTTDTHFAKLVLEGKLYEFMATELGGKYFTGKRVDRFGTRALAKREMLKLMYFDSTLPHSPSQKPFAELRQHFPGVARVMDRLKRRSYRDFSVLLQKLEAHLLLHKVCRKVYQQNPSAWFTTIHDAIVTTAEHAALVESEILATYQRILGTAPSVKRTDLHPLAAYAELSEYVKNKLDEDLAPAPDEPRPLALTLEKIKLQIAALNARRENTAIIPEAFLFGVDAAGMGVEGAAENPFAPPRRKLKKSAAAPSSPSIDWGKVGTELR